MRCRDSAIAVEVGSDGFDASHLTAAAGAETDSDGCEKVGTWCRSAEVESAWKVQASFGVSQDRPTVAHRHSRGCELGGRMEVK